MHRVFISILLSFILILGLSDVYADTTFDWGQVYQGKNYNNLTTAWIGDCNSSSCTIVDGEFNSINGSSTPTAGSFYGNTSSLTIASNGVMLAWLLNERVKSDYLYSLTTYICSNKNLFSTDKRLYLDTSSTNVMARPTTMIYQNTGTSSINGQVSEGKSFNYCHAVSSLFVPNRVGSTFGIRITSSSSISGAYVYLIGYELESLGIYSDTIKEILEETLSTSTSGLATTQQLNQVANEIKQEQQSTTNAVEDVNDSVNNVNESITSEESPNLDGLSNTAGWLPPGPVDSILNLPLTFFNNLTTNLGKSCTPINLPLPYVNQDLTLPCINTIYEKLGITTFINFIGVIVGALILYSYLLKLYQWVDNTLSFNENTDSVDNWGGV